MNESFWYIVELVGFILAGAMLVLNIILFIRLEIPVLIGELSGRQYEKEVKQIRDSYVDYDKRNHIRRQGLQRKETARPNPVEKMIHKDWQPGMQPQRESNDVLYQDNRNTEVLSGQTTLLSEQTTLLESQEITTVLQSDTGFRLVRELLLINTDERVEERYS